MATKVMPTSNERSGQAMEALLRALGPAGTIRFLRRYGPKSGDCTKERRQWLAGVSFDEFAKEVLQIQCNPKATKRPPRTRKQP